MPRKNETVALKIEDMTNLGFGVARLDGLVVFVSGAVKGDEIIAKLIKVTPSYAVARIEKLTVSSPLRVLDRCSYEGCHSCAYKNISYTEEQKIKAKDVKEAFIKAGLPNARIAPLVPSPKEHGYRNKAQYPITRDKNGEVKIGFFAPKSHRVTEARRCPLAPAVFGDILDTVAAFVSARDISTYDEESGKGLLRHIYLRRGEVSGEILLTIVINGDSIPYSDELVSSVCECTPSVVGILINKNKKSTNVVLGDEYEVLYGRDYIYDTLAGVELKIAPSAFYQVNHASAELLYSKARELAELDGEDTLLDLYCGTGSIGLSMANDAGELVGIEIVESAVECARENAKRAGLTNARFFAADADDTERLLAGAEHTLGRKLVPSVIILDPPRAGCGERAVRYVASLNPKRIVYISCNPVTLARDVKLFCELGYEFGEVTPVDLFPMTGHVESVVCLTRRLDNELPMA